MHLIKGQADAEAATIELRSECNLRPALMGVIKY